MYRRRLPRVTAPALVAHISAQTPAAARDTRKTAYIYIGAGPIIV